MVQVCKTKYGVEYYGTPELSPIIDINTLMYVTSDFGLSTIWEDRSGYIRNGTNYGAIRSTSDPLFGSYYTFNGTSSYINFGTAILGNLTAFTMSAWFRTISTAISTGLRIYTENSSTSTVPLFNLTINDGILGDAKFGIRDDSNVIGSAHIAIGANDGKWHNITGVQRSKSLRELYFDGVLVATNTLVIGNTSVNNSNIGVQNSNGVYQRYFSGDIGSVILYNRALSSTEILSNYQKSIFYYMTR